MAYTITPTNGQNPIVIADGTINTSTTVTLVGKNYPNYGNILDQNFIKLLENSSNTTAPASPLTGEIWWDSGNRILKVYTGSAWKNVGSTTASSSAPSSNNNVGDLWWDTTTGALWGYDGITQEYKLIGPIGGLADISSETISDGASNHTCLSFKLNSTRYMIFSTDAAFSPSPSIDGFQTIYPGLNLASSAFLTNAKFTGLATDSVTVGGILPSSFIRADQNASTTGTLSILNNNGLNVGTSNNLTLAVSTPNVSVTNQTTLGYINFNVHNGSGTQLDAVDIYPNGNLVANYDLTVKGQVNFDGGSGDFLVSSTTASTNTVTGALQVRGGAGVAGNFNVGGSSNFAGQLRGQSLVSNTSVSATLVNATNLTGSLTTAAQGNITSVGSLTSLTCIGTATLNNINISGVTTLGGAPTSSLHAATKAYVDSAVSAGVGGIVIPSVPGVSGSTNQIAVFSGSSAVGGSSGLTYNGTTLAITGNLTTSTGLTITGAITATGDITAFSASDVRLKTNITTIEDALNKVASINGVTFNWNDLAEDKDESIREAGVIAQEIQAVLPEVVTQRDNGYLAVRYEKIIPLLIEAIKELKTEVENLKSKNLN